MTIKNPLSGFNKPGWELHDLHGNPEHDLAKSVSMEFCDIAGVQISYYKRDADIEDYDVLYGENEHIGFHDPITTKVIYEVDQEPNIYSVFGMYGEDTIIAYIPKGTYYRDIDKTSSPNDGDVIKTVWNNRNFQIVHVDDDERVFQLYKYVWILTLRPYAYSFESDSAAAITSAMAPSAYSDNEWIEEMSDSIDNYSDVDSNIYGF
jgi:hypothetical protein